jgi:hypothetical protein
MVLYRDGPIIIDNMIMCVSVKNDLIDIVIAHYMPQIQKVTKESRILVTCIVSRIIRVHLF